MLDAFTAEHCHASASGGSRGEELLAEGAMPVGGSCHGPSSPRALSGVTSAWRHRGHAARAQRVGLPDVSVCSVTAPRHPTHSVLCHAGPMDSGWTSTWVLAVWGNQCPKQTIF